MSDEEQLRLIATVQDRASLVLRKIRGELRLFGETRIGEGLKRDVERMNVGLERMRDRFKDIRRENVRGLFEGIGLGAISAGGGVAGLSELLKSYAEQREGLADMAKQINFNVQSLHLLQGAGERMGIGTDQMNAGLQSFNKALADMRMHQGELYTWLSHSNSPLEKQIEHAKTTQRAFELYIGYLATLKNQAVRDRFAQYGFHDQAFARFAEIEETKENLERERRFGFVIKPEDIEKARKFQGAMDDIKTSMRGLGDAISSKVMPVFTPMMEDFANWVRDHRDDIANWFRDVAEALRAVDWRALGQEVMDVFQDITSSLKTLNDEVQNKIPGGWKTVIGGLIALKALNATGLSGLLGGVAGGAAVAGLKKFAWPAISGAARLASRFGGPLAVFGGAAAIETWLLSSGVANRERRILPDQLRARTQLRLRLSQENEQLATMRADGTDKAYPQVYANVLAMRAAQAKQLADVENGLRKLHREAASQKSLDDRAKATGQSIGSEASKSFIDGIKQWLSGFSPMSFDGAGPGGGIIKAAYHPGAAFARKVMGMSRTAFGGSYPQNYAPGQVPANMIEGARRAYGGLRALGFNDIVASALAGNLQQESSFNPNSLNAREGAHGIMQWRLGRWTSLQNFAASIGKSPNDFQTQLAFIKQELNSPAYRRFLERLQHAKSLAEANHILHGYIGYGDNSEGTRGRNAASIQKRLQGAPDPVTTHKVNGEATIRVKFDGLPAGSRANAHTKGGLFREVKLDLGQSMQGAFG
ncbi:hypothetical protein K32_23970 [Kaistia sp. 32K]|uniref:phage tail tip lysozyme n=1 Tax=Kaistia sp. 32K TaxID=2795690 RepID=UPI0019152CB8|nr:phage tail tip lysozyme [Kaistia sp. 32K]BCP53780.1 hypothetical protein K32_23970 [Kaistia sp. 32K]